MSFAMVAAGVSAGSAIYKIGKGIHQNNLANKVVSPEANFIKNDNASLAKMLFNARQPGMASAERNIQGNNANTQAGIQRNSTDGSQSLAMLAAAQGQTDQSFQNLGQGEGQYKLNMLNNLQAQQNHDTDMTYQDAVRKQQNAMGEKGSLRQAGATGIGTGLNELGATAGMANTIWKNKNG